MIARYHSRLQWSVFASSISLQRPSLNPDQDGQFATTYISIPNGTTTGYTYNFNVYHNESLQNGYHTFTIQTVDIGQTYSFLFDYLIYTCVTTWPSLSSLSRLSTYFLSVTTWTRYLPPPPLQRYLPPRHSRPRYKQKYHQHQHQRHHQPVPKPLLPRSAESS